MGVHPGASRDLLGTGRGQRKEAGHGRRGKGKCVHRKGTEGNMGARTDQRHQRGGGGQVQGGGQGGSSGSR
eukprot:1883553-Heterocapsa_arctica.AAC.1